MEESGRLVRFEELNRMISESPRTWHVHVIRKKPVVLLVSPAQRLILSVEIKFPLGHRAAHTALFVSPCSRDVCSPLPIQALTNHTITKPTCVISYTHETGSGNHRSSARSAEDTRWWREEMREAETHH